ncbi:MAG: aminopeptidase [Spirochaetia bacterium]|nr:aminopeptidase [Spirochaetia bacterium]
MNHPIPYYQELYAQIILHTGINMRAHQNIVIKTSPKSYEFAQTIAAQAYRLGAGFVYIDLVDYALYRERMSAQDAQQLSYVPHFEQVMQQQYLSEDWGYIRIDNTEDRSELSEVPTDKLTAHQAAIRSSSAPFRTSMMNHEHPWCVVCAPGPKWAQQVLGEDATEEDLFEVLIPILRLDEPDPIAAWDQHAHRLLDLSQKLTDLHCSSLHITDQVTGTDLHLGLHEQARWVGGPENLPGGQPFFANIPTEEVFTVPLRTRTEGVAYTTKPLTIFGTLVDGCSFTFREGKVVDFSAETGEAVLEQFLKTDEGASFLGEVAIVDKLTPIAQSGKVFGSILYDENAACHIALGAGYPTCLAHGHSLKTDSQLHEAGCNTSLLHTDFMIGSPATKITARTADGRELQIMTDGSFTI